MSDIPPVQTEVCPQCFGTCNFIGVDPPSKFPALRDLNVVQERFQCEACAEEWVRNRAGEQGEMASLPVADGEGVDGVLEPSNI